VFCCWVECAGDGAEQGWDFTCDVGVGNSSDDDNLKARGEWEGVFRSCESRSVACATLSFTTPQTTLANLAL